MSLYWLFLLCFLGYCLGNVNFAIIISRGKGKDITTHDSGNPGTMNMVRAFGFKIGLITLLLDALKGIIPALTGYLLFGGTFGAGSPPPESYVALYACGLAVILGHCFPIFRKFKGGKGVATMFGVFMVAHPWMSLAAFAVAFVWTAFFEYGAMGSFIFMIFMISYAALQPFNDYNIVVCSLLFVYFFLAFFLHRKNIFRLLIGKENRLTYLKSFSKKKLAKRQEQWLQSVKQNG